jgi:hypothetical protein
MSWGFGEYSSMSGERTFTSLSLNSQPMPIQQGDGALNISGSWSTINNTSAMDDSYLRSSASTDDVLSLDFVGTAVDIIYVAGPDYGSFEIEIDGVSMRSVDSNAELETFGQIASISGLSNTQHTLRIIPLANQPIAIDSVLVSGEVLYGQVTPTATVQPTIESTQEPIITTTPMPMPTATTVAPTATAEDTAEVTATPTATTTPLPSATTVAPTVTAEPSATATTTPLPPAESTAEPAG